jgi:GWxTD domain-containing protein
LDVNYFEVLMKSSRYTLICLLGLLLLSSSCFLFRSGHLNISTAVKGDYEQGQLRYRAGDFPAAEALFRKVIDVDGRSVLAKYGLGLALYQQDKISGARKQFVQIMSMSRNSPYGYHGLGLIALKGKNRKFEALQRFREALRCDPDFVDARWQLALTRLSLSKGLFGAFAMGDIRREFRKVTALDPDHPEAFFMLGKTYYEYGKLDEVDEAIPLFERQVAVSRDHYEARFQLGLAYIDVDRIVEGISMLELIRTRNPEWTVKIDQAVTEAKFRNELVHGDSIFIALKNIPEKERRLYYDLKYITPVDRRMDMEKMILLEAEKLALGYWKEHDPSPETSDNIRLVEHCKRVAYARRHFGRGVWPWDRRGEVYIRYGEPGSRETSLADAGPSPTVGSSAQFGVRQIEKWVYKTPPLAFEFIDQGANYVFDAPLVAATGDISTIAENAMYDQGALLDEITVRTPSVYTDQIEQGPPIRFSYSLAVFRGENGQPELEIDYAVPANELTFEDQRATLKTALILFDEDWREVEKTVESQMISGVSGVNKTYQVAMYRRTIPIPAGPSHFALHITDAATSRSGISRQPLDVLGYKPGQLGMSDVRLVSNISTASEGPFIRGGRRLIPNPAGVYSAEKPVMIYFEIYNLTKNSEGRTNHSIEYTIFPLSGGERPVVSAIGAQALKIDGGREFALLQEEEGVESNLQRDIVIDMQQSQPGRYALQVTITDRHQDISADRTVLFRLVKR